MPGPLKNSKHEIFAQEMAKGTRQKEAYAIAGYTGDEAAASKLGSREDVRARIDEIVGRGAKRAEITVEYVLTGIRDVTERCAKAGEDHNPAAALKGYELLGKHLKLFTEKHEHSNPDGSLRPSVIKIVAADDRSGTATPS